LAVGRIPVIVGPTAVGKTAVALSLDRLLPLEIISADSRQVYRRLDIGTAKPTAKERQRVVHHGIDVVDPGVRYSAGRFAKSAPDWIEGARLRGRQPVVAGGTGLYIRALVDGLFVEPALDPASRAEIQEWAQVLDARELVRWASRLDAGFRGGGAVEPWYVVLTVPRQVLHQRIERRAREMVERGLIEEVAAVLSEGLAPHAPGLDGIGMREAVEYLHGKRSRDSVADAIATSTRRYAKRQETWFRHQLRGDLLVLDAVRPPDQLAQEIATRWRRANGE